MIRKILRGILSYRWLELSLLLVPCMILLLEMSQLLLIANIDPNADIDINNLPLHDGLIPIIGLIGALLAFHLFMNIFFRQADQVLFPLVGLISGIGVLMATRLGPDVQDPQLGTHQLLWVLIGLLVCAATQIFLRHLHWLQRYKYTAALLGVAIFCATLVNTFHVKNLDSPTHDQLKIGTFNFQPSELLKICIVIFFAAYLTENREILIHGGWKIARLKLPPLRQLGPLALMLGISLLLFLFVRELGLALLIYGIFLSMVYLGTQKMSYVLFSLGIAIALGFVGYRLFSYVQMRFRLLNIDIVHWNTQSQALYEQPTGGYQIVQGIIALSSGGLIGSGLGLGAPYFVSVVQSDMIFSGLGEEFGLVGLFGILALYLLIIHRGFRIAAQATDTFSQLLAAGLTSIFAIQALIISAGNLKLIPLTGIPLPFLSYGGSSIFSNFIIVGILLRISHTTALRHNGDH